MRINIFIAGIVLFTSFNTQAEQPLTDDEKQAAMFEEIIATMGDQLIVAADKEIIKNIAYTNPEGALILNGLAEISKNPLNALPTEGSSYSGSDTTIEAVIAYVDGQENALVEKNPATTTNTTANRTSFKLEEDNNGYFISLKHRVIDKETQKEIKAIYPDIKVSVDKITRAGVYYKATGWSKL